MHACMHVYVCTPYYLDGLFAKIKAGGYNSGRTICLRVNDHETMAAWVSELNVLSKAAKKASASERVRALLPACVCDSVSSIYLPFFPALAPFPLSPLLRLLLREQERAFHSGRQR